MTTERHFCWEEAIWSVRTPARDTQMFMPFHTISDLMNDHLHNLPEAINTLKITINWREKEKKTETTHKKHTNIAAEMMKYA